MCDYDVLIRLKSIPKLYHTYKIRFAEDVGGKITVGIAYDDSTSFRPIGEIVSIKEPDDLIFPKTSKSYSVFAKRR